MTNEQINTTIAEACGYKNVAIRMTEGAIRVITGFKHHTFDEEIPDYLNDLNAMHEAENVLDNDQGCDYSDELELVVKGKWGSLNYCDMQRLRSATAAQRAEAFLKTIKKWNSDKI